MWVGERGDELRMVGRGCTVPGLAAILRAQTSFQGDGSCWRGDMRARVERVSGGGIQRTR